MKHAIKILICVLLLGFIFSSCHQNESQKNIIGTWKGTAFRLHDFQRTKFPFEITFSEDGKALQRNYDAAYTHYVTKYKIKGDSIIWISDDGKIDEFNSHIEFLSENKLNYSTITDLLTLSYDLDKVVKENQ